MQMQGGMYHQPLGIMDVQTLFRTTAQQEAALKALVRSRPFDLDEIDRQRATIREGYLGVILTDPAFAASKDVEQSMWKTCFYRKIEDYRKRIRKQAAAASGAENRMAAQKARQELHLICTDFNAFLTDALGFYQELLNRFEVMHRDAVQRRPRRAGSFGGGPEGLVQQGLDHDFVKSIHRTLIFLGDLARYRELHSENVRKDWSQAERFYYMAIDMLPSSGNPHNQLAVLATYTEAECVAVYRYCRALLCEFPFPTAQENLTLLFEKNKQNMPEAGRQSAELEEEERLRQGLIAGTITGQQAGIARATMLKSFLQRFVRMHGMLFAGQQAAQEEGPALPVDEFLTMLGTALADLRQLLKMSAFGDGLLLHMVVICIFSVLSSLPSDSQTTDNLMLEDSSAQSLALALAFGVSAEIAACVRTTRQESEHTTAKPPGSRLLGPVVVFCDWLASRPALWRLRPLPANGAVSGGGGSPGIKEKDREAMSREQFWATLARIATELQPQLRPFPPLPEGLVWVPEDGRVLKEQHDLRGFQPLVEVYGRELMTRPKAELGHVDIVSDDLASSWRTFRLISFLQSVGGEAGTVTWAEAGGGMIMLSGMRKEAVLGGPGYVSNKPLSLPRSLIQQHRGISPANGGDGGDEDEGGDDVILFKPSFSSGGSVSHQQAVAASMEHPVLDDSSHLPREVLESMLGGLLDCSDSGPHPPASTTPSFGAPSRSFPSGPSMAPPQASSDSLFTPGPSPFFPTSLQRPSPQPTQPQPQSQLTWQQQQQQQHPAPPPQTGPGWASAPHAGAAPGHARPAQQPAMPSQKPNMSWAAFSGPDLSGLAQQASSRPSAATPPPPAPPGLDARQGAMGSLAPPHGYVSGIFGGDPVNATAYHPFGTGAYAFGGLDAPTQPRQPDVASQVPPPLNTKNPFVTSEGFMGYAGP